MREREGETDRERERERERGRERERQRDHHVIMYMYSDPAGVFFCLCLYFLYFLNNVSFFIPPFNLLLFSLEMYVNGIFVLIV